MLFAVLGWDTRLSFSVFFVDIVDLLETGHAFFLEYLHQLTLRLVIKTEISEHIRKLNAALDILFNKLGAQVQSHLNALINSQLKSIILGVRHFFE